MCYEGVSGDAKETGKNGKVHCLVTAVPVPATALKSRLMHCCGGLLLKSSTSPARRHQGERQTTRWQEKVPRDKHNL